jgi:hypothetical protein
LEVDHAQLAAELLLDELLEVDDEPVDGPEAEDVHDDVLTVKGQVWRLNQGRTIDRSLRNAYSRPSEVTLHNFTECNELQYFKACFPDELVPERADRMTHRGHTVGFGTNWEVTPGDVWLFFGMLIYMLLYPYQGDRENFWMVAPGQSAYDGVVARTLDGTCNVYHNLGRFGMTSSIWRNEITRAFLFAN